MDARAIASQQAKYINVSIARNNTTEMLTCLGTRNTQEAHRHEHPINRNLVIAKLDSIEIQHAQAVCSDETVQSQDLVHLDSGNQGAAALTNDSSD